MLFQRDEESRGLLHERLPHASIIAPRKHEAYVEREATPRIAVVLETDGMAEDRVAAVADRERPVAELVRRDDVEGDFAPWNLWFARGLVRARGDVEVGGILMDDARATRWMDVFFGWWLRIK